MALRATRFRAWRYYLHILHKFTGDRHRGVKAEAESRCGGRGGVDAAQSQGGEQGTSKRKGYSPRLAAARQPGPSTPLTGLSAVSGVMCSCRKLSAET